MACGEGKKLILLFVLAPERNSGERGWRRKEALLLLPLVIRVSLKLEIKGLEGVLLLLCS